ncbi:MAG: rhomboid family intramembrane serine protease [Xanthomonadales bacterium]|nr:rhomboid family intramembrane serine protease [Xanthomonadales bacterium]
MLTARYCKLILQPGSSPLNQRFSNYSSSPLTDTPVSFGVIILCAVVYFTGFQPAGLALWPLESGFFAPWQLLTYGILHGNFNHLFFNMFAVWMFGTPLERSWGTRRYLSYFAVCVAGAAVAQLGVQLFEGGIYPTIGASGGVFGLLLAYGVMWPNNRIFLLFFPVPVPAKWFVLIYGGIELLLGFSRAMPGIAHFAHLGGMVFGALLLYRWGWRPGMTWKR